MAKAISHSAAILHRAQTGRLPKLCLLWKCGLLIDQLIQAEIGRWLDVNHSKVHSDLRVLDDVLAVYREMLATRPWVRRPDGRAEADLLVGYKPWQNQLSGAQMPYPNMQTQ